MATNIITDGQAEMNFVARILNFLEQKILYGSDAKNKLAEALFKHFRQKGDNSIHFKMVSARLGKEFEEELTALKMPFVSFLDDRGNSVFLTRDIDKELFLQIQENIFKRHPEYYMENTVEDLLTRESTRVHQVDIMRLEFDSQTDLDAFRNKAFEKSAGYVYATEVKDGKYYAYTSMKNAFSNNYRTDIPSTILRLEADKIGPNAQIKQLQLMYDRQVQNEIISRIRSGQEFVVANAYNNKDSYFECINGQVQFMIPHKESGGYQQKRILPLPTDWTNKDEVDAFESALAININEIRGAKIMSFAEHTNHLAKDAETLKNETNACKKAAYEIFRNKHETESLASIAETLSTRPTFDDDFIKFYSNEVTERTKEIDKALSNITIKLKLLVQESKEKIAPLEQELVQKKKQLKELNADYYEIDFDISADYDVINHYKPDFDEIIQNAKTKELSAALVSFKEQLFKTQIDYDAINQAQSIIDSLAREVNDAETMSAVLALKDKVFAVKEQVSEKVQTQQSMKTQISEIKKEIELIKNKISVHSRKLNGLFHTREQLTNEKSSLVKDAAKLNIGVKYKNYLDRAIDAVIEKAHIDIKSSQNYALMSNREKTSLLETTIENIINLELVQELTDLKNFAEKNGIDNNLDELLENVREMNRDKVNPHRIEDILQEIQRKKELEASRNKRPKEAQEEFTEPSFA